MSDLEKWRQKIRENSISDPDKILEYMLSHAAEADEPFRLEVLYKPEGQLVIIQGNTRGFKSLSEALSRLIEASSGSHIHFDNASNISKSDIHLIIQKVDDEGDGPHTTE